MNEQKTSAVNAAGVAYPSLEEQQEYWRQYDLGGNWTPDRIEANQDWYESLRDDGRSDGIR